MYGAKATGYCSIIALLFDEMDLGNVLTSYSHSGVMVAIELGYALRSDPGGRVGALWRSEKKLLIYHGSSLASIPVGRSVWITVRNLYNVWPDS